MSKLEVKKKFDCIDMKRKAQERIYRDTKGMSGDEEIAYFRRRVDEGSLGDFWRKLQKMTSHAKVAGKLY